MVLHAGWSSGGSYKFQVSSKSVERFSRSKGVEICHFLYLRPVAYITACTTIQAVIVRPQRVNLNPNVLQCTAHSFIWLTVCRLWCCVRRCDRLPFLMKISLTLKRISRNSCGWRSSVSLGFFSKSVMYSSAQLRDVQLG